MRTGLIPLVLATTVTVAPAYGQAPLSRAPASERSTQAFSFMGETTTRVTKRRELNGNPCYRSGDELECFDEKAPVLDGSELVWLNFAFHRRLLWRFAGGFKRALLPTIVRDFTVRFGTPAPLPKPIDPISPDPSTRPLARWLLTDGILQIESVDVNDDMLTFVFVAEANRPAATRAIVIPVP